MCARPVRFVTLTVLSITFLMFFSSVVFAQGRRDRKKRDDRDLDTSSKTESVPAKPKPVAVEVNVTPVPDDAGVAVAAPEGESDPSTKPADVKTRPDPDAEREKSRQEVAERLKKLQPFLKSGVWPPTWKVEFEHENPTRVVISSQWKKETGKVYWYFVYRVKNTGKEAVPLRVDIELRTNKGMYYQTPSPSALKFIQKRERRTFKGCLDVRGELEPGKSIEAVAIFTGVSEESSKYEFVVMGLNNTYRLDREEVKMYRRVLKIVYERPGDEFHPYYDLVKATDVIWAEEEYSGR